MNKKERQREILSIIGSEAIGRQYILTNRLRKSGFKVSQASVSRDLDELGILKPNGVYVKPQVPQETQAPLAEQRSPEAATITFESAGPNLILGKCQPGLASAFTVRIDAEKYAEIVGTIAGDDTIFIAVKDAVDQNIALERLCGMFG